MIYRCSWLEIAALAFGVATIGIFFRITWRLDSLMELRDPSQDVVMVNITLVQSAVKTGAVCLDGSPPAYHLHRGSESRNWLVYLEGGAWCSNHASCFERSKTYLGSSKHMERAVPFTGILSPSRLNNPDFYNWNRIKVRYCDGASFGGNVEADEQQEVVYRGYRIWRAVIQDLLSNGMLNAEKAFLVGCSAGGLATILHCDNFKELLPPGTYVKCLSDGGFFLDEKGLSGTYTLRSFYKNVVDLHSVETVLPKECVEEHGEQCFFPQYISKYVKTPVFILNSGYDVWQLQNVLVPESADDGTWSSCRIDPYTCTEAQLKIIEDFRNTLLKTLSQLSWSVFVNGCFSHCHVNADQTWSHVKVSNKTMMKAVGDWYFERSTENYTDCSYPCNPTCPRWQGWAYLHRKNG